MLHSTLSFYLSVKRSNLSSFCITQPIAFVLTISTGKQRTMFLLKVSVSQCIALISYDCDIVVHFLPFICSSQHYREFPK